MWDFSEQLMIEKKKYNAILKTEKMTKFNTPWIDSNIVQVDYFQPSIPTFLLRRLSVKLMTEEELKTNDLYFSNANIVEPLEVPKNAKIVVSTNPIKKTIFPNQYYFQGKLIQQLDIEVVPSFDDLPNSVNLVVSGATISNLQYYKENDVLKYNLYMYHMHLIESEDKFSQFWSANGDNIMKYTNIHLLELSSYYLVEYLCKPTNTNGKTINLYVYDENDIKILSEIFENDIIIGSNVTINFNLGWKKLHSESFILNYMNLILKMTEYKMRNFKKNPHYNKSKQFKLQYKKNTETLSKNYLYFECAGVLLEKYIEPNKNTIEDYKACLLALRNLELLNSTTENTNKKITNMNNEYAGYAGKIQSIDTKYTTLKTNIDSNSTQLQTLEQQINTNNTNINDLNIKLNEMNDRYDTHDNRIGKIAENYALETYVDQKENDIYNTIDLQYETLNESFFESLQQLSQEFNRMKMDSENTTKSINALYVLIATFVIFFIILINIRTSKKKK